MKKTKLILLLVLLISVAICLLSHNKRTYVIQDNGDTLVYNNSVYNQIPYDFEFCQNRHLLPNDRVDFINILTKKENMYVFPQTYYVYKGDNFDSPTVIYKQNNSFGVSGWLYIKDGFNYTSNNVETHKIVEVFVEHVDSWSTEDSTVIERFKMAILNKEDLVPIVSEYSDIEWYRLYVRYENSPFVQEIGRQKSGEFQYNN